MRKNKVIITLIVFLLLINAGIFGYVIYEQKKAEDGEMAVTQLDSDEVPVTETEATEPLEQKVEEETQQDANGPASHVYAHRGSSGDSLEHSFQAYDKAIADGATHIEQDIVISRDGTLYVSHDQDAGRMTGTSRSFESMSDSEIDQLTTKAGEHVLRLSEVFDKYGENQDLTFVIELKDKGTDMTDAFAQIVKDYEFEDRVIAQCFKLETLEKLEGIFPDMPKLYLCKEQGLLEQGYQADYVDIIGARDFMMTEDNVNRAHEMGKEFNAWPINSEGWIRQAIVLNVDSYFTDNVELAIRLENEYGTEKRSKPDNEEQTTQSTQ